MRERECESKVDGEGKEGLRGSVCWIYYLYVTTIVDKCNCNSSLARDTRSKGVFKAFALLHCAATCIGDNVDVLRTPVVVSIGHARPGATHSWEFNNTSIFV